MLGTTNLLFLSKNIRYVGILCPKVEESFLVEYGIMSMHVCLTLSVQLREKRGVTLF